MSARHPDLLLFERPLLDRGEVVVGLDEVGRGALAGPLTVGAVVLSRASTPPIGLTDSKLLSALRRESLVDLLIAWADDWSLGSVSAEEIDQWGLRLALAVAATRALNGLRVCPTHALIDGPLNLLRAPLNVAFDSSPPDLEYHSLAATTIVKGDQRCATIAAASVLAKVNRDRLMTDLDLECQGYGWASNKGYGSRVHLAALRRLGPHAYHRRSWRLPDLEVGDDE